MQADSATFGLVRPDKSSLRLKTTYLFLAVSAATIAVTWYFNTFVMTREVYHTLLGDQMGAERVDQFFNLLRQRTYWSHGLIPLVVLVRVGFVALMLQLVLLLMAIEAPLARLFRCALWAFGVLLVEAAARALSLSFMSAAQINQTVLSTNPVSLGYWVLSSRESSELAIALAPLTLTEAAWLVILIVLLAETARLRMKAAAIAATSVWLLSALVQVTFALYFFRL